jgi:hypothetical protein
MPKMAVEIAGLGVDIHKWASLEKTQVFSVKPLISLTFIRVIVAIVFIVLAIFLTLV